MRWRIGKFAGTELWLHGATLLCWAYLLLQGQGMLLAVGLVSIALHEGAHGLASAMLHHPPRQAEITPLGLLLRLEEEDRLPPLHRAAVLFAGPAASAALVLLGWYGTRWGMLSPALGARMFFGNLMLLALNLLPALPLDGGRLLALALSLRYDLATQMKVMRVLGMILGLGLAGVAVASAVWWGAANFSLAAAGCFLIYASQVGATTEAMAALRQFLDRRNRLETSGMMRGEILAVLEQQPLRAVLPHLRQGRYTCLAVLESGTLRMRGLLDEDTLQRAYLHHPQGNCASLLPDAPEWSEPRPNQHVDK